MPPAISFLLTQDLFTLSALFSIAYIVRNSGSVHVFLKSNFLEVNRFHAVHQGADFPLRGFPVFCAALNFRDVKGNCNIFFEIIDKEGIGIFRFRGMPSLNLDDLNFRSELNVLNSEVFSIILSFKRKYQ